MTTDLATNDLPRLSSRLIAFYPLATTLLAASLIVGCDSTTKQNNEPKEQANTLASKNPTVAPEKPQVNASKGETAPSSGPAELTQLVENWPKVDLANLESRCKQTRGSAHPLTAHDRATCLCLRYQAPRTVQAEAFRNDPKAVLGDELLVQECEKQALPEMIAALGQDQCTRAFAPLIDPPKYCECVTALTKEPISPPRTQALEACLVGQAPQEK